jgi:hypothetical protein
MLIGTDSIESEIVHLRSRICGLERCVCELLLKNERLRSALSRDAFLKWVNRPDEERENQSYLRQDTFNSATRDYVGAKLNCRSACKVEMSV